VERITGSADQPDTGREDRAAVAQRIDGRVAISDVPVDHADRAYLIELQHAGGLAPGERPQPAVALPARSSSVTEAGRPGAGHDHHRDREQLARTEVLVEHHEAGQRGDRRVERHQHAEHRLREPAQRL
jgi:hypothetical protein